MLSMANHPLLKNPSVSDTAPVHSDPCSHGIFRYVFILRFLATCLLIVGVVVKASSMSYNKIGVTDGMTYKLPCSFALICCFLLTS